MPRSGDNQAAGHGSDQEEMRDLPSIEILDHTLRYYLCSPGREASGAHNNDPPSTESLNKHVSVYQGHIFSHKLQSILVP